jgi:glucose-6-phosphate 1-dehydrogenase
MQKTTFKKAFQMIIFGASGDLASLMLFPAIYELFIQNRLGKFQIIGFARSHFTLEEFRKTVEESVKKKFGSKASKVKEFVENFYYFQGNYDQTESFEELKLFCEKLEEEKLGGEAEKIAYFSVPPQVYKDLLGNLSKTLKEAKLIIEKPFGSDGKTAKKLFAKLKASFKEKQIFLLDHYLGKRAYQSIYKLRFQNSVINNLISGKQIANIQISALEKADAAKRVGYFDQVGIIKDMIQSHLLQVLALITMEIEANPDLESISKAKNDILKALKFSKQNKDLALGQYKSYKKTDQQVTKSKTETYAAVKLKLDKKEWAGIPIYIRTGKNLAENNQRVVLEFKRMPFQSSKIESNKLIFEIKPEEN